MFGSVFKCDWRNRLWRNHGHSQVLAHTKNLGEPCRKWEDIQQEKAVIYDRSTSNSESGDGQLLRPIKPSREGGCKGAGQREKEVTLSFRQNRRGKNKGSRLKNHFLKMLTAFPFPKKTYQTPL